MIHTSVLLRALVLAGVAALTAGAGAGAAPGGATKITHYRVDQDHSNAYEFWRRLGSPIAPDDSAYAQLLKASELATLEPSAVLQLHGGAGK